MRPVIFWGGLGCPKVSLGALRKSDRPTQLSTSDSFHKNMLFFS